MFANSSTRVFFLLLGAALLGTASRAQTDDQPASPIPANMVIKLRANLNKQVTVRGRVASTGQSRSGHQFLNFASSELTAVCYPEHVANFHDGKPAKIYRGKNVELTGKLELYKNKLQIRLRDPAQIRIVTAPTASAAKGVKLKKIGKETWLSPAGLSYRGRDPAGLTRVEHIARHLKDQPTREGPHGVFDGGSEVAFAVIDEAWRIAQQRRLRPKKEGDRSSYTVSMGRRIGYLGGRKGTARRHPPLTHLLIVFRTGTKEIVTAFPK